MSLPISGDLIRYRPPQRLDVPVSQLDVVTEFPLNSGKVDPKDHSLLITEPPFNFTSIQERYDQFVFEEYGFDGVYIAIQAVLTLYAQGTLLFLPLYHELNAATYLE